MVPLQFFAENANINRSHKKTLNFSKLHYFDISSNSTNYKSQHIPELMPL